MMHVGLIGKSLAHSFSKDFFTQKFQKENIEANYHLVEMEEYHLIKNFLATTHLTGINVTIPYKVQVMQYCDVLDESAKRVGAVNCLYLHQGKWIGYNTDEYGFLQSIKPFLHLHHQRALILGTGGASLAVMSGLKSLGVEFKLVSRKAQQQMLTYDMLNEYVLKAFPLIINTTPVGMYPNESATPLFHTKGIGENHLLMDLIYNPEKTKFLAQGEAQGAQILNGIQMLHHQAEKSWEIWTQHH